MYNCRSLTIPLVPQEESRRHSVSGLAGKVTRSRTRREGLQQPQPQPPQQHEAGLRRGRVPALLSGHGRPQGIGPPALVPVDPDLLQTFSFVQRFRHSDLADGRAEHVHQQHRRVTRPAHRVNSELAVIHRREDPQPGATTAADPGGVEGLLTLGWVQPQPTAVSLKLAWGRTPHERYLVSNSTFTTFQNLA